MKLRRIAKKFLEIQILELLNIYKKQVEVVLRLNIHLEIMEQGFWKNFLKGFLID